MIFEIYKDNLKNNIHLLKKQCNNFIAVVKNNAYGFEFQQTIENLIENNINRVFVYDLIEALKIRKIFSDIEIICLYENNQDEIFKKNNIIPIIYNLDQLNIINIPFWLFVNTGWNVLGINFKDFQNLTLDKYNILGIMSHFLNSSTAVCKDQYSQMEQIIFDYSSKYEISLSKSSALSMNLKNTIRPGHALYFNTGIGNKNIGRVLCYAKDTKFLKTNECVGYDKTFKSTKEMKIAFLGFGYAYGLDKDQKFIFYNNERCNILGKVSMSSIVVDITHIKNFDINIPFDILGNFQDISLDIGCAKGYLSSKISFDIKREWI